MNPHKKRKSLIIILSIGLILLLLIGIFFHFVLKISLKEMTKDFPISTITFEICFTLIIFGFAFFLTFSPKKKNREKE